MLHAVIMAGGSGTRFWPASRRAVPKQLLRLTGERTMIQSTADRLGSLVPAERKMVVTNAKLVDAVRQQLPELPAAAVIGEPCKRDTAPCVGLAAVLMVASDPEATMLVMPADHVITPDAVFQQAIRSGVQLIDDDPGRIVTFGVPPTYAAESFGYVERGADVPCDGAAAYQVQRFREKPDLATAEKYLQAGTFYWNSGIFLWRAATILDALAKHEPQMLAHLQAIGDAVGQSDFEDVLEREFTAIDGKSVDYAVMERHQNTVVIEAPFHWDDVGSWQSLSRMNPADAQGNTRFGKHIGVDTAGSIIYGSEDHVIVTIDVDDLIVVHTPHATLVAPRSSEERVREAVKRLEADGLEDFL